MAHEVEFAANAKMTRAHLEALAWTNTHRDYRSAPGGRRSVLVLDKSSGATVLQPLDSFSTADLARYVERMHGMAANPRHPQAGKWFVSRQVYWPGGEHAVEVSAGLDHASPGMIVVGKYKSLGEGKEFSDPREAAEAAILVRRAWARDLGKRIGLTFGDADFGWEPRRQQELLAWADKVYEKAPKCARCGDVLGKERYTLTHPYEEEGEFCSSNCADRTYEELARELEPEFEENPRLKSTQETAAVERLVRSVAAAKFGRGRAVPVFEHGQWFVDVDGRIYSVVDAVPGFDGRGISFEAIG